MSEPTYADYFDRAWNWVSRGMDIVTSADAFYALLRDTAFYVTREVAREVWKEYGKSVEWQPLINRLPPNYVVPRIRTVEREWDWPEKYTARAVITGTDIETGEIRERLPYAIFDKQVTIDEIMGKVDIVIEKYNLVAGLTNVSVAIQGMYHKRGAEW